MSIITGSGLVPFLEQILPFGALGERISASEMITRPLADFPMLYAARRGWYFGQMLDGV